MHQNSQEVINQVINKAWEDSNFKEALKENPVQAIESLTGESLDYIREKGIDVVVHDQSNPVNTFYITIPENPNLDVSELELTDEQLEAVAGGAAKSKVLCISKGRCSIFARCDGDNTTIQSEG